MRSPAPMYNVAMRWGGVGLSTYMQCRCSEAILFDTSKKEVNGYIVVHETARPFDRTAVASPRRTARESRETRGGHTRPHSARAAPPPAAPATAHEPRRSTHGRSHTTHQPATGAGRRGRGGAGGGHVVPSVCLFESRHDRACPHASKGVGPHPWQHTLRGALRLGSTAHPVLSPSCSSPIAM